jgi:hypothetical protein
MIAPRHVLIRPYQSKWYTTKITCKLSTSVLMDILNTFHDLQSTRVKKKIISQISLQYVAEAAISLLPWLEKEGSDMQLNDRDFLFSHEYSPRLRLCLKYSQKYVAGTWQALEPDGPFPFRVRNSCLSVKTNKTSRVFSMVHWYEASSSGAPSSHQ